MNSEDEVLTYRQRFKKLTFKQRKDLLIYKFKGNLLRVISSSRFKNKLEPYDKFTVNKRDKEPRQHFEERIKYRDLNVYKIIFFEVLEIDDFDSYKKIISSKFVDEGPFKSERDKDKLRDNLDKIKGSLDSIHYGGDLYYLKFKDKSKADLLGSVQLGYIKTLESYFILTIEVKPSLKFQEIFQSIIDSDDYNVETIQYHKLSTILKKWKFVSHSDIYRSSISQSIHNLMSDLNFQVKLHITDHLKGQFYKKSLLPRIEHYQVDKMEDFEKDELLKRFIGDSRWTFKLDDNKIHISIPEFRTDDDYFFKVLKEKGHGTKEEQSNSDLTDYDWVESHYLNQSLSLPCALGAILSKHHLEVRGLKRRVYDYINESSKKGITKKIQFLKASRGYINLKVSLARNILLFKRFEEEFGKRTLRTFSDGPKLSLFKRIKFGNNKTNEQEDLETVFQNSFNYQIENLNKKISTLEQVFRPIEEVSIYRTNFWLQITSIGIGILAIILTADKAIEIIKVFVDWVKAIEF